MILKFKNSSEKDNLLNWVIELNISFIAPKDVEEGIISVDEKADNIGELLYNLAFLN